MKVRRNLLIAFSLLSLSVNAQRIKGSDTVLPVAQQTAERYMNQHPDARVTVTGGGTGVGISALMDNTTDIAMASRPIKFSEKMKIKEAGQDVDEIIVAYDALAVVVHPSNPVKQLTRQQLEDIFRGKITNWKDVGGKDQAIVAFQRGEDSGSQTLFQKLLIQGGPLMEAPTELAPTAMGELVDSIAEYNNSANAIGFSVYYYIDQMYSQPGLRLLAVDGVTPGNLSLIHI